MNQRMTEPLHALQVLQARPTISGARVGTVIAVDAGGVLVDFAGNPFGAQRARRLGALSVERLQACRRDGLAVLLMFEENDPRRPIVVDVVVDEAAPPVDTPKPVAPRAHDAGREPVRPPVSAAARLGRIVGTEGDSVLVQVDGDDPGARPARCALVLRNLKDPVVLLAVEAGDWVIVGQLHAGIPLAVDGADGADVVLKGTRVHIEADVELILKSGTSSLRLDARGKAVTLADQVVSSARGANKVLGGSVQLN